MFTHLSAVEFGLLLAFHLYHLTEDFLAEVVLWLEDERLKLSPVRGSQLQGSTQFSQAELQEQAGLEE